MTGDDTRIQEVESRIAKLEQTVYQNHVQQNQNARELAAQISQVQTNVDQQGRAFQAHLDEKLDNQLACQEKSNWMTGRADRSFWGVEAYQGIMCWSIFFWCTVAS